MIYNKNLNATVKISFMSFKIHKKMTIFDSFVVSMFYFILLMILM